jgi:hypothetical protein
VRLPIEVIAESPADGAEDAAADGS